MYTTFGDFVETINESHDFMPKRSLILKRKYKEGIEERVGIKAPLRTKVLTFLEEKGGKVTNEEMEHFISLMSEKEGPKPSWEWLKSNKDYIEKVVEEGKPTVYRLTKKGKKVLEMYKKYEEISNFYKEKYYPQALKTAGNKDRTFKKFLDFTKKSVSENNEN